MPFNALLGVRYEEVEMTRQKPAPDGLLHSIESMVDGESGTVLYVGDHPTDVEWLLHWPTVRRAFGKVVD